MSDNKLDNKKYIGKIANETIKNTLDVYWKTFLANKNYDVEYKVSSFNTNKKVEFKASFLKKYPVDSNRTPERITMTGFIELFDTGAKITGRPFEHPENPADVNKAIRWFNQALDKTKAILSDLVAYQLEYVYGVYPSSTY